MKGSLASEWLELIGVLENLGIHHGAKARWMTKDEVWQVMEHLYAIAVEVMHDDSEETNVQPQGSGEVRMAPVIEPDQ